MKHSYPEEKRLFPRLLFKEKALFISPDFLGLIKDVSMGGLSFTYYEQVAKSHNIDSFAYDRCRTAEITLAKDSLVLDSSNFQIIDSEHSADDAESTGTLKLCRVNFNGLAGQDIIKLWRFMQSHCRYDLAAEAADSPCLPYGNEDLGNNECQYEFNSAA
jgi:hypothetical protein